MLNTNKVKVMEFGPKAFRDGQIFFQISKGLKCTVQARNLRLIPDPDLYFNKHFSQVTRLPRLL